VKKSANLSQNPLHRLEMMCNDIDQWPISWAGDDKDVIVGRVLLGEFKHYLLHLMTKGRANATIKKHADYLWALGGEIIRDTNEYGVENNLTSKHLVLKYINNDGGPYWRHANSEAESHQYDATCRQLFKYLIENHTI